MKIQILTFDLGKNFGSDVGYEEEHMIYFYLGSTAILLWKAGWVREGVTLLYWYKFLTIHFKNLHLKSLISLLLTLTFYIQLKNRLFINNLIYFWNESLTNWWSWYQAKIILGYITIKWTQEKENLG